MEGAELPWHDLITFLPNSEKPRDAAMRNTGTGFVVELLSTSRLVDEKIVDYLFPSRLFVDWSANGK